MKAIQQSQFRSPVEQKKFVLGHNTRKATLRNNSLGNGMFMQHGRDQLLYLRREQELRIYTENQRRTQFVEARASRDGVFTMVLIITETGVTKATGAAEIKALACYAELHGLWMLAISKGLVA